MLARDVMTKAVTWCTPWDTAQTAAKLMKAHDIGALPVVSDKKDPLLEGIVTDRDLCCGVVAEAKNGNAIAVAELMTPVPVTCEAETTIEDCEELMAENQVRRLPVVDRRGRCIGIVTQADIARNAPASQVAKTIREISVPASKERKAGLGKKYLLDELTHEEDQILLLQRRRELRRRAGVLR